MREGGSEGERSVVGGKDSLALYIGFTFCLICGGACSRSVQFSLDFSCSSCNNYICASMMLPILVLQHTSLVMVFDAIDSSSSFFLNCSSSSCINMNANATLLHDCTCSMTYAHLLFELSLS